MRDADVGNDLTQPMVAWTTNGGTSGQTPLISIYPPQPIASAPTAGVPDGSLCFDLTGSAWNVCVSEAWAAL